MKKLSDDIRRMMDGLAHQDAADYLSMRDKYRELGIGPRQDRELTETGGRNPRRRVALVSDGRDTGAHIDYAIDACRRQRAGLDIVLHGKAAMNKAGANRLLERVRGLGIDAGLVTLDGSTVQALNDYVAQRPSLLLLVAEAGDALSRAFTESAMSRSQRLYVPMVMIEDRGEADPLAAMSFA